MLVAVLLVLVVGSSAAHARVPRQVLLYISYTCIQYIVRVEFLSLSALVVPSIIMSTSYLLS